MDDTLTVRFRVADVYKGYAICTYFDNKLINKRKRPVMAPGEMEQVYIRSYAQNGYQLRNKTSGSQGKGKTQIDEYRPAKGYRDGIIQGRKSLAKELGHIIDKHLVVSIKPEKQHNKVSQQAYEKFMGLINPEENEDGR